MAVGAKWRRSLHIEECNFREPVLNKILYLLDFNCINRRFTAKYTSGKLVAKLIEIIASSAKNV